MLRLLETLERELLLLRERPHLSRSKVAKLDGAKAYTHQSVHLEPNRFAQPAHLAVSAFRDGDAQLPAAAPLLLDAHLLRLDEAILELHALLQHVCGIVTLPDDRHDVHALHF